MGILKDDADDLIRKQVAIDAINSYFGFNIEEEYGSAVQEVINGLPSAQPEPCDDPRADVYYLAEKIGIHRLYELVVELRGDPEPCEDAVSREAVSEWLKQYGQDVLHGKYKFSLMYIWKNLMGLPSAQPERMCNGCRYERHGSVVCDSCSRFFLDRYEVDNNE